MSTIANLVVGLASNAAGYTAGMNAARGATDLFGSSLKSARGIYEATRTPAERYTAQLETLKKHLDAGKISLETYERALRSVNAGFANRSGGGYASQLMHIAEILGAGALIERAASSLKELVTTSMEAIESSDKLAISLGATVEEVTALQGVAKLAGASDAMGPFLQKMLVSIGNAAAGVPKASAAFKNLGLDIDSLKTQSLQQQFTAIADAISHMTNAADRAKTIREIGGKGGMAILPAMEGGADSINETIESLKTLGVVVNDVDAAKIHDATRSMRMLGLASEGLGNVLAVALSPYIRAANNELRSMKISADDLQSAASSALNAIGQSLITLAPLAHGLYMAFQLFEVAVTSSFAVLVAELVSFIEVYNALAEKLHTPLIDTVYLNSLAKSLGADAFEHWTKAANSWDEDWGRSVQHFIANINKAGEAARQPLSGAPDFDMPEKMDKAAQAVERLAERLIEAQEKLQNLGEAQRIVNHFMREFADASADQIGQVAAIAKQTEFVDELNKQIEKGKRLAESGESPLQKYAENMEALRTAVNHGAISWAQYADGVRKANEELAKGKNEELGTYTASRIRLHGEKFDQIKDPNASSGAAAFQGLLNALPKPAPAYKPVGDNGFFDAASGTDSQFKKWQAEHAAKTNAAAQNKTDSPSEKTQQRIMALLEDIKRGAGLGFVN